MCLENPFLIFGLSENSTGPVEYSTKIGSGPKIDPKKSTFFRKFEKFSFFQNLIKNAQMRRGKHPFVINVDFWTSSSMEHATKLVENLTKIEKKCQKLAKITFFSKSW